MTDEATLPEGAESAAATAETVVESKPQTDVERLKAILTGKPKEPAAESSEAPAEGKPAEASEEATATEDAEPTAEDEREKPEAASETPDLKAVAKLLGVQPSELVVDESGALAFKTKVDGMDGKANLESLRKSFQLESAHTRRLMELSEQKKSFEAERQQAMAAAQAEKETAMKWLALARNEVMGEYGRTDWEALRVQDPVEFASRWAGFQHRSAAVNQALEQMQGEFKAQKEAAEKAEATRLQTEFKELVNRIPAFADEGSRKQTQKEIAAFLKSEYDFSDADVKAVSLSNARAVRIVHDLWDARRQLAEMKAKQAVVQTKVAAAPKLAKAGSPAAQDSEARKLAQLRVAVKKGDKKAGPALLKRVVYGKR